MKVLQVLPALQGGGVEKGTLEIAQALRAAGHESWVMSAGGSLVNQLLAEGSRHETRDIGRKSPASLLQIWSLRRWLQQQQFDIIHVRSRMPAWVVWLAWRGMAASRRPRLVTTLHGLHSVSRYSEIMGCGERVIVVSETTRQYLRDNYPRVDQDKVRLIYRGIEPELFYPGFTPDQVWSQAWQQQYPQLDGRFVICLPGRLTRLKGHLPFLQLIRKLCDQGMPVMGLIVGGEDPKRQAYAAEVRQQVVALNLQQHIVFTGQRRDIREIFSSVDLVLSLSTKPESFGRTVLEALSLGTPVLGYDHGGVSEILAALYPYGKIPLLDDTVLVDRVQGLIAGQAPAVKRNQQFLLPCMCDKTLAVYQELLAQR